MTRNDVIKWAKIILILPIVLVWDVFYWTLTMLHKGATWIDENGAVKLEKFVGNKPW